MSATFPQPGAPKGTINIKADLLVTNRHSLKPEARLIDITVTYPNVAEHSSSNHNWRARHGGQKAAEEVKDAWHNNC